MNLIPRRRRITCSISILALGIFAATVSIPPAARADNIFVENGTTTVSEYSTTGTLENTFVAVGTYGGFSSITSSIATNGANLYVGDRSGRIAEYTASGTPVSVPLTNTNQIPTGIAFSGPNMYAMLYGQGVAEYNAATGATMNSSLIPGVGPYSIAASGSNLFVVNTNALTIGEYTASGAPVATSLITGLSDPYGIAIAGSDLFVSNYGNGTIGEYTTSGAVINATLVAGLGDGPRGIAISGSDLFLTNDSLGTISEYTLGSIPGTVIASNPNFVIGLGEPVGIVVLPNVPEPASISLLVLASAFLIRRRPAAKPTAD